MISIVLTLAVVLIVLITSILGWRKKHYAAIDRAEEKKLELMNSPILEEVAQIRTLNVAGEVKSSLSEWKEKWDEIMTVQFPKLEEDFFECEALVEKFRFKKANIILEDINKKLDDIEVIFEKILSESGELLKVAKHNEERLNRIQDRLKGRRQHIVAVDHLLGESAIILDEQIATLEAEADEIIKHTTSGGYFAAELLIESLEVKCQTLEDTIKVIPDLINECNKNIPAVIEMLKQAKLEMENDICSLEGLKIGEQIKEIEVELKLNRQSLEIAVVDGVKEALKEIDNKINDMCRLLEGEVTSKKVVTEKIPKLIKMLGENKKSVGQFLAAVDSARGKYRIQDDVEDALVELKVRTLDCAGKLDQAINKVALNEEAFSIIEKQLEAMEAEMTQIKIELTTNIEDVASLMTDEQSTIKRQDELREIFSDLEAQVRLSNLPGISIRYQTISSDTLASIEEVDERLLDKPLNIAALKEALQSAERKIATLQKESKELIENAQLAEKVIQYGNRYRIESKALSAELDRATEMFMIFEYTNALEVSSIAIEQVEPGFATKFSTVASSKG